MLIDTKTVKRLNFPLCKSHAAYLLACFLERNQVEQAIQPLVNFMEWLFVHNHQLLVQSVVDEYIEHVSLHESDDERVHVKSFCDFLQEEGFCGSVIFPDIRMSEESHTKSDSMEGEASHVENNDGTEQSEQPQKRRRGRPRKSEQKVDPDDGIKPEGQKRRRGRPRKSEQVDTNTSSNEDNVHHCGCDSVQDINHDDVKTEGEPQKRRRGRPRKNQTVDSPVDEQPKEHTENREKKRRGRPPKGGLRRVSDYYKALGVSPTATQAEIKIAFRALAKKFHPDLHADDPDAETRIKSLNRIMEVLKDNVERMVYDVAMGFLEYDEKLEEFSPYKNITWHPKRYYYVFM